MPSVNTIQGLLPTANVEEALFITVPLASVTHLTEPIRSVSSYVIALPLQVASLVWPKAERIIR